MTSFPDLFADLAAPFDPKEIRVRTQAGHQLSYITARTAMNRLDDILGPENWCDEYLPGQNSVLCRLTITLPDGKTVTKCDAGGYAGMADSGDDDKSGFSDAFKRACAKFGVGRYLYRDGVPAFCRDREVDLAEQAAVRAEAATSTVANGRTNGHVNGHTNGHTNGHVNGHTNGHANGHAKPSDNGQAPRDATPKTGRALFAWTKEQEGKHEVGLLKYLNSWAKLQDFPGRMVDWDAEQVALAYSEAVRKLQAIGGHEARDEALSN
jgi:hypothetical protein